jgi:CDP-4-dehydro-6-deoxyglucose reductase
MSVALRLPAVEEFHFRPGQYLDVMVGSGRRRSFSIASARSDGVELEQHVRRASSSGFTGQLFDAMTVGTLLRIEGPLGQFWLRGESPRPPIMIGGGTGDAPLRAMLRQLIARSLTAARHARMLACAPQPSLRPAGSPGWRAPPPGFAYAVSRRPASGRGLDRPHGWSRGCSRNSRTRRIHVCAGPAGDGQGIRAAYPALGGR